MKIVSTVNPWDNIFGPLFSRTFGVSIITSSSGDSAEKQEGVPMKVVLAFLVLFTMSTGLAGVREPARRVRGEVKTIPGRALCRDSQYECMYDCTLDRGALCVPTRSSDPNCPSHVVKRVLFNSDRLALVGFESHYPMMSCKVTALPKSNLHCGDTDFGWDCWTGAMKNDRRNIDY